jgi:hypothetical protein
MAYSPLNVGNHLAGVGLIPAPIKVFSHRAQLDDKIAGQIIRFGLAALFAPKLEQRLLAIAHNDAGVRAADKRAAIG